MSKEDLKSWYMPDGKNNVPYMQWDRDDESPEALLHQSRHILNTVIKQGGSAETIEKLAVDKPETFQDVFPRRLAPNSLIDAAKMMDFGFTLQQVITLAEEKPDVLKQVYRLDKKMNVVSADFVEGRYGVNLRKVLEKIQEPMRSLTQENPDAALNILQNFQKIGTLMDKGASFENIHLMAIHQPKELSEILQKTGSEEHHVSVKKVNSFGHDAYKQGALGALLAPHDVPREISDMVGEYLNPRDGSHVAQVSTATHQGALEGKRQWAQDITDRRIAQEKSPPPPGLGGR